MVGAFLDVMLLCFQMRDSLLVEAQSCGDGPQFVKGHLRTAAVCLFEKLDVPHDGAKVAAGIVETADHAEKQQQQQKADDLQYAFQQNLVIVASGEQHSQRMGLCISAGCQKRLGKPYKGELGSAVGGESLPNALFRQYLIRHQAQHDRAVQAPVRAHNSRYRSYQADRAATTALKSAVYRSSTELHQACSGQGMLEG